MVLGPVSTRKSRWLSVRIIDISRGTFGAGLLALGGILLSGCTGNGLSYFSHVDSSGESVFYAIPASWQRFSSSQVIRSVDPTLSMSSLSQIEQRVWGNIIDARQSGSLKSAAGFGASYPFGIVKAQALTTQEQDAFSLASLRTLILPTDPLASSSSSSSSSSPRYKTLGYSSFVRGGGFRGSTMTVTMAVSGAATIEFEQVAMVNPTTTWAYVLGIGCTVRCFQRNQAEITSVIKSFGVEAVK